MDPSLRTSVLGCSLEHLGGKAGGIIETSFAWRPARPCQADRVEPPTHGLVCGILSRLGSDHAFGIEAAMVGGSKAGQRGIAFFTLPRARPPAGFLPTWSGFLPPDLRGLHLFQATNRLLARRQAKQATLLVLFGLQLELRG